MESNVFDGERNRDALERYIYFFNHLNTELDKVDQYVTTDIVFQDPFNRVTGIPDLQVVLKKFADSVQSPHFEIIYRAWDGNTCLLRWEFSGTLPMFGEWRFPGVSELHFSAAGKVCKHIDHWDAGEHFYQRLPVLGRIILAIRRRL